MTQFATSITLGLTALLYCTHGWSQTVPIAPEQVKAAQIQTVAVNSVDSLPSQLTFNGRVMLSPGAFQGVALNTESKIVSVLKSNLSVVRKGDRIAAVSSTNWLSLQAEFLIALADQELAYKAKRRDEKLLSEGLISASRMEVTTTQWQVAQSKLAAIENQLLALGASNQQLKELKTKRKASRELVLVAPKDGQVEGLIENIGAELMPGQMVFQIVNPSDLYLELAAPIESASLINKGSKVAIVGCDAPGTVSGVGVQIDAATQSIPVRVELTKAHAKCLWANQLVNANVETQQRNTMSFQVPESAIITYEADSVIFKRTSAGFDTVKVKIQGRRGKDVVVTPLEIIDTLNQFEVASSGTVVLKGALAGLGGE